MVHSALLPDRVSGILKRSQTPLVPPGPGCTGFSPSMDCGRLHQSQRVGPVEVLAHVCRFIAARSRPSGGGAVIDGANTCYQQSPRTELLLSTTRGRNPIQ